MEFLVKVKVENDTIEVETIQPEQRDFEAEEVDLDQWVCLDFINYSKYYVNQDGEIIRKKKDGNFRKLKPTLTGGSPKKRYLYVTLTNDQGEQAPKPLHWVLARAYVQGYSPELECDHIDGNQLNNSVTPENCNLRWVTHKVNMQNRKKKE